MGMSVALVTLLWKFIQRHGLVLRLLVEEQFPSEGKTPEPRNGGST